MTDRYDVLVVGAGIVGLASALRLLERHPRLRLAVRRYAPELRGDDLVPGLSGVRAQAIGSITADRAEAGLGVGR